MAEMTRAEADAHWARHFRDKSERLEAENARLREQLRIATELLERFAEQRGKDMRYPGEHATLAEDALICISVVE
jgi:hypothetical protein